jgi:hypothetical protein
LKSVLQDQEDKIISSLVQMKTIFKLNSNSFQTLMKTTHVALRQIKICKPTSMEDKNIKDKRIKTAQEATKSLNSSNL